MFLLSTHKHIIKTVVINIQLTIKKNSSLVHIKVQNTHSNDCRLPNYSKNSTEEFKYSGYSVF